MTSEQIRIAVAEEMGFQQIHLLDFSKQLYENLQYDAFINRDGITSGNIYGRTDINHGYFIEIPDYDLDLNACHEMEKLIRIPPYKQWCVYCDILRDMCGGENGAINATPLQRCEAFLRVRNKWRDK